MAETHRQAQNHVSDWTGRNSLGICRRSAPESVSSLFLHVLLRGATFSPDAKQKDSRDL